MYFIVFELCIFFLSSIVSLSIWSSVYLVYLVLHIWMHALYFIQMLCCHLDKFLITTCTYMYSRWNICVRLLWKTTMYFSVSPCITGTKAFIDHLSSKLKWVILIACHLTVSLSVNFHFFIFFWISRITGPISTK